MSLQVKHRKQAIHLDAPQLRVIEKPQLRVYLKNAYIRTKDVFIDRMEWLLDCRNDAAEQIPILRNKSPSKA